MVKREKTAARFLGLFPLMREKFFRPVDRITRSRLSHTQFHALAILRRQGAISMSDLAHELHISKQQLTPIVDQLIEMNYVYRKQDEGDRRRVLIGITEAGEEVIQDIRAKKIAMMAEKLDALTDEELDQLVEKLDGIREILNKIPTK